VAGPEPLPTYLAPGPEDGGTTTALRAAHQLPAAPGKATVPPSPGPMQDTRQRFAAFNLCRSVAAIWPHKHARPSATTNNVERRIRSSADMTRAVTKKRHTVRGC
jgi:hypothetical protein